MRVNDRFQIDDPEFARRLWEETALRELVLEGEIDGVTLGKEEWNRLWGGEVLGLNPNIRIYRYSEGQFFDQHCMIDVYLLCLSLWLIVLQMMTVIM